MEFCERGDLWNEIRRHRKGGTRFEEKQVWDTGFQLLLALHDCHSRPEKILHRDIKPANIFIDRLGTVKLGDFGLARVLGKVRWSRVMEHRNTSHVTRYTLHVTRHSSHVTPGIILRAHQRGHALLHVARTYKRKTVRNPPPPPAIAGACYKQH